MNGKKKIKAMLKEKILLLDGALGTKIMILDGAMGTELQKRGMPAGECPERWCLNNPEAVCDIHRSYVEAGADVIYTATFGANRLKLGEYDMTNVRETNRELARLAKRAAGNDVLVAGDMGPTGQFVEPFGPLAFEDTVDIYKEQVQGLMEGGVDLFVIETMIDIQEARAALLAVKETAPYFTIVTMSYEKEGRTLNGTDPLTALVTLQSLGADAVGCNCSTGPDAMVDFLKIMKPYAKVPLVVKPNAGIPRIEGSRTVFDMSPDDFASYGPKLAAAGANIIGGCCGTTPEFIRLLKKSLAGVKPMQVVRKSISAVSSAWGHKIFKKEDPLTILGERLNPTGKKRLQQELLDGNMSLVRQMAKEQEQGGAELLDVNVGVPGIDEVKTIKEIIRLLATASKLPLVIDSSKVETIEAALRFYPGRAFINSITGETDKLKRLLPVAAKYGAMFILLPLADGEIPETSDRRKEIIRAVFRKARLYGFTKEDVVVDALVMTVASNPQAAVETIKTIKWSTERFGCMTSIGLSNVSFGMPEREWLNAAFLSMTQAAGLTMAIANPGSEKLIHMKSAGDVLLNKDKDAAAYIARFSAMTAEVKPEKTMQKSGETSPLHIDKTSGRDDVRDAVIEGNREGIVGLLEARLATGEEAANIVDDSMIPAIMHVGELFEKKIFYLPQLIASAETMKKALSHLEPRLKNIQAARAAKGSVMMATVKGDIHDIGKNIIVLLLQNQGYQVIDLGKDVTADMIVNAMKTSDPDVVGLSALMTTTMVQMKEVIELAAKERLPQKFMVGGAVVTEAYARSIGASYAKDGVEAVKVVEKLIKPKTSNSVISRSEATRNL
ncbi:MAG: homocysteine S-methyltransferase family protein [Deltaproteobacteria bacterium]|nr:homocysteine S-methyltransferase family protein [Deltaproteobacteria bacterium]